MGTFQANLFKDRVLAGDFNGAPRLEPNVNGLDPVLGTDSNSTDNRATAGQTQDTATKAVDIHGEYPWTVTDDARNYVPKLRLIEYRLTQASELNGAWQTVRGAGENPIVLASMIKNNEANANAGQKFANAIELTPSAKTELDNSLKSSNLSNQFIDGVTGGVDILRYMGAKYLDEYRGLYTVEPTKWEYILPYLGASNMMNNTNTFSDYNFQARFINPVVNAISQFPRSVNPEDKSSRKSGGIFKFLGAAPDASNVLIAGAPGAIKAEAPQSFTGATKEALQVTFYLLNTISPEHIRKNWEFCYLFSYQNLPNRRSINLLDAPRIYTAQILGYKTIPACYISDLKIENVGAVRMIDIGSTSIKQNATNTVQKTRAGESTTMKMIPEAYKISFTLQSVFINSQNLFRLTLEPGGGIITTSIKQDLFTKDFRTSQTQFNVGGLA